MTANPNTPYRGLWFFDWTNAADFFGRELVTRDLLARLNPSNQAAKVRFLGIIGASGSGKSSLARAGLVAQIRQGSSRRNGGIRGSQHWPAPVMCTPGSHPLEALAEALLGKRATAETCRNLVDAMLRDSTGLHEFVCEQLQDRPPQDRQVVLFDQFEEIFTLCSDLTEQQALIDNLHYAATVKSGQTIVILTIRADFYGHCAHHAKLNMLLSQHQLLLGPMNEEELTDAIIKPAIKAGCAFEADLVETIKEEVMGHPNSLPLLQHSLLELWRQRQGRRLTREAYLAFGGLQGALEQRAELLYESLSSSQQEICRRIFLQLTQIGEGSADTRRRVSLESLVQIIGQRRELLSVLHAFASPEVRLLMLEGMSPTSKKPIKSKHADSSTDSNAEDGVREGDQDIFVEVSHEALIRGWRRLRTWLHQSKDAVLFRDTLIHAMRTWEHTSPQERPSRLLQGSTLQRAETWMAQYPELLSDELNAFLQESLQQRARERDAEQRREDERQHALVDREMILKAHEAIQSRKEQFLHTQESQMQTRQRWLKFSLGTAFVLLVLLVWGFFFSPWRQPNPTSPRPSTPSTSGSSTPAKHADLTP